MTSLRVALKLSMAEVKPESGRGGKKKLVPQSSGALFAEEDPLLHSRKRKSSFGESKEHKSKSLNVDKSSKTSRPDVDAGDGSGESSDEDAKDNETSSTAARDDDTVPTVEPGGDDAAQESLDGRGDTPLDGLLLQAEEHAVVGTMVGDSENAVEMAKDTVDDVNVVPVASDVSATAAAFVEPIFAADSAESATAKATALEEEEAEAAAAALRRKKKKGPAVPRPVTVDSDAVAAGAGEPEAVRYQSHRAAAIVAKTKLISKPVGKNSADGEDSAPMAIDAVPVAVPIAKMEPAPVERVAQSTAAAEPVDWVQCDSCAKWRSIASHIPQSSLPDQWFCRMNTWSARFNSCEAPDEAAPTSSRGRDRAADKGDSVRGAKASRVGGGRSRPRGRDGPAEDEAPRAGLDAESDGDERATARPQREQGGSSSRRKSGSSSRGGQAGELAVPAVNWVMCNKCRKWRKVPETVRMEVLPDKWFCSMNSWAPALARCSAKEEQAEPEAAVLAASAPQEYVDAAGVYGDGGSARLGRDATARRRSQLAGVSGGAAPVAGAIKKVSWVQCERRNCKKWRKVPAHIDTEQFPERWFCEMNSWDADAANCDAPEVSDSEEDPAQAADTRSQLILANSKGPGTLSYRRIIFGTDGKIRSCFSDKNRNGFGVFSHSEPARSGEQDEYQEPTRRVAYWWSGAYDEAGRAFAPSKGAAASKKTAAAAPALPKDTLAPPEQPSVPRREPPPPTILLDAARRLAGLAPPVCRSMACWPKKLSPTWRRLAAMTVLQREHAECVAVRSCFLAATSSALTLAALEALMASCRFLVQDVEACREHMGPESLKAALRRLEEAEALAVSVTSAGLLLFELLEPRPPADEARALQQPWAEERGLPLRLRKFHKRSADGRAAGDEGVGGTPSSRTAVQEAAGAPQNYSQHRYKHLHDQRLLIEGRESETVTVVSAAGDAVRTETTAAE